MRVLALDTTSRGGSVALVEDGRVLSERASDPSRTPAERLPRELLTLVEDHRMGFSDVDVFAVASGPGSFTGLRVGIATVQGLAFVHRRRVAAVSALGALAQIAAREHVCGALVGVWMDARRGEVFSALYTLSSYAPFDSQRLMETEAPSVGPPAAILGRWARLVGDEAVLFAGDGAVRYGEVIQSWRPGARVAELSALAGAIGLIGGSEAASGRTVPPAAVRPLYVRRPDAELDRDKKTLHHGGHEGH